MSIFWGIIFAFGAFFGWGFGDFYIQKNARAIGIWRALFFVCVTGAIALTPFVLNDIEALIFGSPEFFLLGLLGIVVTFAALFDFAALKTGKIAVIEPLLGLELPVTIGLSVALASESISIIQGLLILFIATGILMAVTIHHSHLHYHKRLFEKGIILAGIGAICMALTNFLVGIASRQISPLMANWSINIFITVISALYLVGTGNFSRLVQDIKKHKLAISIMCFFDNIAWIFYAYSTSLIPISITTTISESYIALTVLLGFFINGEKLKRHQIAGVVIAILGIIMLSATMGMG